MPQLLARLAGGSLRPATTVPTVPTVLTAPWAAVAIVLTSNPESLLLIRRAEKDGDAWSGHLAFPGGRSAPNDTDLLATARRETWEEVGVDLTPIAPIGQLVDFSTRSPALPPLVVRPFVFLIPAMLTLRPNLEVAAAWWLPLESLLRPGVFAPTEFRRYGTLVRTMGYHLEGGVLWGMTERILTPLLDLIR